MDPCAPVPEDYERISLLPVRISPERRGPLPFGARVAIFIIGWLFILIGIAGLVLPVLQGGFFIVLGAALLSLDNELVYRGLRKAFQRWPKIWDRIEGFRERTHDWIDHKIHRKRS